MSGPQQGFTYNSSAPVTDDFKHMWMRELASVMGFAPPNPNGLTERERMGWGFPEAPPVDCYDFVSANAKKEIEQIRLDKPLRPEVKYSLLTCLTVMFAWLQTQRGAAWLLHLYGIREVQPHHGYGYFYDGEIIMAPKFWLRIFSKDMTERTGKTPTEYYGEGIYDEWKKILEMRRNPGMDTKLQHPSDGMWKWVASFFRNWLTEVRPDTSWPHTKHDRISGYLWAKNAQRLDWAGAPIQTELRWGVIDKMHDLTSAARLYRIQNPAWIEKVNTTGEIIRIQPDKPGIWWVPQNSNKMRVVPLDEYEKHMGQPAQAVDEKYRCTSCGNVMCCVLGEGSDRLCMNCKGVQTESGARPSLSLCRSHECRMCPQYVRSGDDLIQLISRLNADGSSGRVNR